MVFPINVQKSDIEASEPLAVLWIFIDDRVGT